VPARIVQISFADAERRVTIEADELSSNYVWDTFTALTQHDAGKFQSYARSDVPPMKPHLAFQATLNLVRQCHALSRKVLERPKPDLRLARRAGWLAFPHIENKELRRPPLEEQSYS
jgi:hypothetical protein